MRWELHPEALQEYQEATSYYAERSPILALRFVEAVEDAIQRILENPFAWGRLKGNVRRCRTRRFPYGVLYAIERDRIFVVAVMHGSREPGYWQRRINGA